MRTVILAAIGVGLGLVITQFMPGSVERAEPPRSLEAPHYLEPPASNESDIAFYVAPCCEGSLARS
jgi:hypothetical protein